ncbi:hypothetical protein GCM10007301_14110 [Azorhizobium oxalatiphilum]|uniref:DUF3592 domain-containing protein n=2 Tax=Azorhizobium oxalatiphilum TaxID=980631 RepID=A0A917BTT4_9HYPH|nr:hypothetical protein GCM10007301_14110 [Azorhizobium oxalatiphilum]
MMFASIGVIVLAIGGAVTWHKNAFLIDAESAPGVVLRLERFRDSDCRNCYLYSPVVRFETAEGREIVFTTKWRSRPARFSRGEVVPVAYLRDDPQDAVITTFWELWGTTLILGGIGGTFVVLSTIMVVAFAEPAPRRKKAAGKSTKDESAPLPDEAASR